MEKNENFWKTLWPLVGTQFLGVFNDHAFKIICVLAASSASASYGENTALLAYITVAYAMPFLLLPSVAGFLADRFSKRNVIVLAKLAELFIMILGILAFAKFADWGVFPLVVVMFLMAAQSCFFSPAYNGILPELFSEKIISRVNGISGMLTMIAVILGMSIGIFIKSLCSELYYCGIILSCISLAGLIVSMHVSPCLASAPSAKWSWNIFRQYIEGFKLVKKSRPIFLSILGDAYFVGMGTAVQSLLLVYGKYVLKLESDAALGLLQFVLAIGMGAGCYLAGRLSGRKVELGLVPIGAAGVFIFLLFVALMPGAPMKISGFLFYPWLNLDILLLGIFGGFFIIPLRAYVQQKSAPECRGTILANANVLCFLAILLSGFLMFVLTTGDASAAKSAESVGIIGILKAHCLAIGPQKIFVTLAFLTLGVTIYAGWLLPELTARFIVVVLTHTVYKIRIEGEENIPEHGPALLVSNHVSFVDALLITACSSRFVRFIMHSDYYFHPLIHPIVRLGGMIPVSSPGSPKSLAETIRKTHEALRNGDVVCIFPEGKITRNGLMDEFRSGFQKMIPPDLDVPIIPVRLGMLWGSIFSYYYGKIRLRMPVELPHPASVTIGKPVPKDIDPFALRQVISLLASETEMKPRDEERPVHYQFSKVVARHPFRRSFYGQDGKSITNFEFFVKATLLSREIRKLSAPEKKFVGILMPNSIPGAVATLAVLMADKVPAMLNYTASKSALNDAIEKAELDCIITSKLFIQKIGMEKREEMFFLEDIAGCISKKKAVLYSILAFLLPHQEFMNIFAPKTHRDVFNTAVLLFSSGSSGSPKGVLLSHHNINSDIYSFWRIVGFETKKDSLLGNLPLFHSFGFTTSLWLPLMTGLKVVYLANPLDAALTGKLIEEHKLSFLIATPTFLQAYMKKCKPEQFKSLRLVVVGAEKMREEIAKKFKEMTGIEPIEGYGCTELSPVVSINVGNSILDLGTNAGPKGSAGAPMPGISVKIVDPETRQELPPDKEGLLLVRGPNVMQGYLKDPERTAKVIVDGWYDTGDIAKINNEGRIFITGRLSRFSKIGGEMVPHENIEAAINEICSAENKVAVVCSVPDEKKGEKLAVLYTCDSPSIEEIINRLRTEKSLPNLWIPRAENFIKVESLPVLGSGKIDLKKAVEIAKAKLSPNS